MDTKTGRCIFEMTNKPNLTPKQERFARAYIETGNASEAYRQAYNAEGMKPDTIYVKACELLKNGKVAVRVNELRAKHAQRNEITVDTITQMLREDRDLAHNEGQAGAAASASMGLAKLHGLIIDRKESGKPGDFAFMSDAELERIAAGGNGVAEPQTRPASPDTVH